MTNSATVLIFKTNIADRSEDVCLALEALPGIRRCTLDLDDCEKVLRVESEDLCTDLVVTTVSDLGFFIEEMPD